MKNNAEWIIKKKLSLTQQNYKVKNRKNGYLKIKKEEINKLEKTSSFGVSWFVEFTCSDLCSVSQHLSFLSGF